MKGIKKIITVSFVLLILIFNLIGASPSPGFNYVGSVKSEKKRFHSFHCYLSKNIKSNNAIYFKTRDEAVNSGYTPCHVCNP